LTDERPVITGRLLLGQAPQALAAQGDASTKPTSLR